MKKLNNLLQKAGGSSPTSSSYRPQGGQGQYAPPPGPPPAQQQGYGHPQQGYNPYQQQAPQGSYGQPPPPRQSYAPPPGPPPPINAGSRPTAAEENAFAALKRYDLYIVLDDSESMEMMWDETRDALVGIAEIAVKYDPDGIDMSFFNNTSVMQGLRSAQDVRGVFRRIEPRRSTPTATALSRVLSPYMDKLESAKAAGQKLPRPLIVLVLTDGAPNRGEEPDEILVDVARRLDAVRAPPFQLGVQFVQLGDDDEAAQALQSLDDDLKGKYGVRDFVDFTPFSGRVDAAFLKKALIGSINRTVDNSSL